MYSNEIGNLEHGISPKSITKLTPLLITNKFDSFTHMCILPLSIIMSSVILNVTCRIFRNAFRSSPTTAPDLSAASPTKLQKSVMRQFTSYLLTVKDKNGHITKVHFKILSSNTNIALMSLCVHNQKHLTFCCHLQVSHILSHRLGVKGRWCQSHIIH